GAGSGAALGSVRAAPRRLPRRTGRAICSQSFGSPRSADTAHASSTGPLHNRRRTASARSWVPSPSKACAPSFGEQPICCHPCSRLVRLPMYPVCTMHKLTDQFNGVFWADDSQIVDVIARKRFAADGRPGVEIIVEPVFVEPSRLARQSELVGRL